MPAKQVSLIVPTMNRSEFVLRLTRYLKATGFEGCLLVGDSSEASEWECLARGLEALKPPFAVVHRACPGLRHYECVRELSTIVSTPYVTFFGDDDLVVPATLQACVEFLERHPDYSSVTGRGLLFCLASPGAYGPVAWCAPYPLRGYEADRASDRLLDLMARYTVVAHAISRTEQFRVRWAATRDMTDAAFAVELLPCSLQVVQGKVRQLGRLFVARQTHPQRHLMPVGFNWITGEAWRSSYQVYRDRLVRAVTEQDGISDGEAEAVVARALMAYLADDFSKRLQQGAQKPAAQAGMVRRLGAGAWRTMRQQVRALAAGAEFAPMYRTITAPGFVHG